jgi:hypothetical protein
MILSLENGTTKNRKSVVDMSRRSYRKISGRHTRAYTPWLRLIKRNLLAAEVQYLYTVHHTELFSQNT